MTYKDYKDRLTTYRTDLLSKEWFLDKQVTAWKNVENFVKHHFSKTAAFLFVFLLGGVSFILLTKGAQLQETGEKFFGGLLICLILVVIAICYFLIHRFRGYLSAMIYHAYVIDDIMRSAFLDEIGRYESELHHQFNGLVATIRFKTNELSNCDPCDSERIKHLSHDLVEFSGTLDDIQKSLDSLRSLRSEYSHSDQFDLNIINAVIEHHR